MYSWFVVHDPGDAPFRAGVKFGYLDMQAMLSHKSFSPQTVLRRSDGRLFVVHTGSQRQYLVDAATDKEKFEEVQL